MSALIELRRELHRNPELSGGEVGTARRILRFFEPLHPDDIFTGLGGNGLAFAFDGATPGPTVLLRCELDALPIQESNAFAYRSGTDGVSHMCGHDGHMAILAAVGEELSRHRPARGRAVLLYQPAEETGAGAAAVVADERYARIRPDFAFALHNLPGHTLGEILVREGTFSSASCGLAFHLQGATAHASQPRGGRNPTRAVGRIIEELSDLPQRLRLEEKVAFGTVTGVRLGEEETFGVTPGTARILATVRAETDRTVTRMIEHCQGLARQLATEDQLEIEITQHDVFPSTINTADAVAVVRRAAGEATLTEPPDPFPWSEDFGRLLAESEGAMFGIGCGEDAPELHGPVYDFPEALIPMGKAMFLAILAALLGDPTRDSR